MDTVCVPSPVAVPTGLLPGEPSLVQLTTYFAPAGRDTPETFQRKTSLIHNAPWLLQALDAMPCMVMILNTQRQIVAANAALLSLLQVSLGQLVELRPGEALNCIRAKGGPDGCGTSRHCATCGAVDAILAAQLEQGRVVRECRILADTPRGVAPLDLRVTTSSFDLAGEQFIVAAVEDTSDSKRLAALQRTFFHDVLNTAGCIRGYAEYLAEELASDQEVCGRLVHLTAELTEAIQAQRELLLAESGDFQIQRVPLRVSQVIEELRLQYEKHPVAQQRAIQFGSVWEGTVSTDRRLLMRVLGNMLKNALEATAAGSSVTVGCTDRADTVTFAVQNPEVMPAEVQLQMFQRSFTTKGQSGRGIGTYSMKLFGERYLGGKVDFTSRSHAGTTFTLTIPKQPAAPPNMDSFRRGPVPE